MSEHSSKPGYILLLSILIIGVVASAVVSSLLLLGTASNRASYSVQQSAQSLAFAQGCAEVALLQLFRSSTYGGNETLTFPEGNCAILPIGGSGNSHRFLCIEATSGDVVRRLEIIVQSVLPRIRIFSWQEVLSFSVC